MREIFYKTPYAEYECRVVMETYVKGGTSIRLEDDEGPIAVCTVWFPELEENEVAVKNYSENAGILDLLIEEEIVWPPHRFIPSGYVIIPVCLLREDGLSTKPGVYETEEEFNQAIYNSSCPRYKQ